MVVPDAQKLQKKKFSKSLGSLLRYMEGMEVIVELKTGKRHRGILASTDEFMNLTLEGVGESSAAGKAATSDQKSPTADKQDYSSSIAASTTTTTPSAVAVAHGEESSIFSSMDIRGANIRYIQFPDNADLNGIVKSGAERERTAAKKYSRGKRKT